MYQSIIVKSQLFIVSRYRLLVTLIFFLIALSYLWQSLNGRMTLWADDEYHTIYLAVQNMFSGTYDSRTFGAARFILRLLTPFSLYWMNQRMGGEHYVTGWDYPGLFYLQSKLQANVSTVKNDPNLQDFIFFQRFTFLSLVLLALFFLFYILWQKFNFLSALVYAVSLCSIKSFFTEFGYAYLNILQISGLALFFGLVLKKYSSIKLHAFFLGLTLGLVASTKLDGLFIAVIGIIWVGIKLKVYSQRIILIGTFISTLTILNFSELRFPNAFLHYTFSQIYHYQTGHYITEPSGIFQIQRVLSVVQVPSLILLLILTYLLARRRSHNISKESWQVLLFMTLLSFVLLYVLQDLRFFLARNVIILGFFLSLTSAILIGEISKKFEFNKLFTPLSAVLIVIGLIYLLPPENKVDSASLAGCKSIGAIGKGFVSGSESRILQIKSIPDSYVFSTDEKEFTARLDPFDCILARWSSNDKTFTNFILPKYYDLTLRFGDYFVFKKR